MSSPMFVSSDADSAGLSASGFRVLAHICRRAGDGGQLWASASRMARECRLDRKTVFRSLGELMARNMIRRQSRPGDTSIYTLIPQEKWKSKIGDSPIRVPKDTPSQNTPRGRVPKDTPAPVPKDTPQRVSPKGYQEGSPSTTKIDERADDNSWLVKMAEAILQPGGKGGSK